MPESASLHDQVIAAVERQDPLNGVIVVKDRRVLADRDPAPDGGCVLVVLDPPPPPDPPAVIRADQRRPAAREPREASDSSGEAPDQGSQPPLPA